ncbi:MAG: hypothetical protein COY39_02100 [Alphaproteobacteria bacterium CG_4_10_14_0_8_um_filter_37_21]|nr:MAG: hypothetical protein COY39_02100 [Alphaproteobacteria bacterium CG_4_10_14_0_8_um_filter_37_21]
MKKNKFVSTLLLSAACFCMGSMNSTVMGSEDSHGRARQDNWEANGNVAPDGEDVRNVNAQTDAYTRILKDLKAEYDAGNRTTDLQARIRAAIGAPYHFARNEADRVTDGGTLGTQTSKSKRRALIAAERALGNIIELPHWGAANADGGAEAEARRQADARAEESRAQPDDGRAAPEADARTEDARRQQAEANAAAEEARRQQAEANAAAELAQEAVKKMSLSERCAYRKARK